MKNRPGYSYETDVEIAFENELQAGSFAMKQTRIGEAVALDLKDEETLAELAKGEHMICEAIFPAECAEEVVAELSAANHVGAPIKIICKWVKND